MERVILLRYGELFLKGRNRSSFESKLIGNIKRVIEKFEAKLTRSQSRYFIEGYNAQDEERLISALTKIFGLHSISPAEKIPTDVELIKRCAAQAAVEGESFRITCKRADKKFPMTSSQLAAEVGGYVLENVTDTKVDLHKPQREITIDLRENGFTYVLSDKIACVGGLPVGTSGSGLLLLSGGIDSPVAGFKMAQRGVQINAIHFCSPPYTGEAAKQKVVELANILSDYTGRFKLFVVPFTAVQLAIHKNCKAEFMITLMRRIMMRISERVASANNMGAIITGESLGQVASQTMQSLTVVNDALELLPAFRPLIGMDKDEIVSIAQKIHTFETSILPYEDCCTVFLPQNPVIKPKMDVTLREEAKLDVEKLVADAIGGIEIINIG